MDKLIQDMLDKGFLDFHRIRLLGKAKPVVEFISMMCKTKPNEIDMKRLVISQN